jgi:hypothetical protein
MAIEPIDLFNNAVKRADHFLDLYDLVHDSRQRAIREDWRTSFLNFMRWPRGERIVRIDGKDKKSMLIIRESVGLTREAFSHNYASELLRGAISASVSALDRYAHELVMKYFLKILNSPVEEQTREFRSISLPVNSVKRAIDRLRENPDARPGNSIKSEIRKIIHRDYTFQSATNLTVASRILGVTDFWRKMTVAYGNIGNQELQDKLNTIAKRRNQIVHEADLIIQDRARDVKMRAISKQEALDIVIFIKAFVVAMDQVVTAEMA